VRKPEFPLSICAQRGLRGLERKIVDSLKGQVLKDE
jgi:hypothetical protein